jgi:very-short-patch-repair endonuclease
MLWSRLKRKQLEVKFRRQHPLGPFIADFYCDEVGLVVEIDSSAHDPRGEHDLARDAWIGKRGLVVLRFRAIDVIQRVEGVLEAIHASVETRKAEIRRLRPERE